LAKEDAGQFEAAAQFYQRALILDPSFKVAQLKAQANQTYAVAKNNKYNLAAAMESPPPSAPPPAGGDLLSNRLQNLSNNIGSNFLPGLDSRESSEEASLSGADVGLENLPNPPTPPTRP